MACFLIPAAEAALVTAAVKVIEHKHHVDRIAVHENAASDTAEQMEERTGGFVRKLRWLMNLLWGGSVLLAFEHLWHGELVPWFPFLTNAASPGDRAEMLHEMATAGVMMAVTVTAVWLVMVGVTSRMEKRDAAAEGGVLQEGVR